MRSFDSAGSSNAHATLIDPPAAVRRQQPWRPLHWLMLLALVVLLGLSLLAAYVPLARQTVEPPLLAPRACGGTTRCDAKVVAPSPL